MDEHAGQSRVEEEPGRWCGTCGYELRGLPASTRRCPECGREFDKADARTYLRRPMRRGARRLARWAIWAGPVLLLVAGLWGWLFWGWCAERRALKTLGVSPEDTYVVRTTPLWTSWPKEHLPAVGFVLDRVKFIKLSGRPDVHDVGALADLTRLQEVYLSNTTVTDLRPLAGLKDLRWLDLEDTQVTDLWPLAGLTRLQWLYLNETPVTDFTPLERIKSLRQVRLPSAGVGDVRVERLERALPECTVVW